MNTYIYTFLGMYLTEMLTSVCQKTWTKILLARFLFIAPSGKLLKCLLIIEWIVKIQYRMEYYIVMWKKGTKFLHGRLWVTLADKLDRKKSDTKKCILSHSIYIEFIIGKTHLSLCKHLLLMCIFNFCVLYSMQYTLIKIKIKITSPLVASHHTH